MLPRQEFWDSLLSLNGLNRKRFVRRLSGNDRMGEEKEKEEKAEEELGECMIDEKEELPVNPQKEGKDKSKEEKEDGNKEDKGKEKEDKDKEKEDKGKEKEEEKEEESEEEEAIPTNTFLLTNINRPTIDNFTCPLCLSTFKDPRITPCCHVFCNVCLSTLDSFECPLCCEPLPPFLSPMSDDSPSFSSFSSPFPIAWGISKELQTREKEDVVMCECCEGPVDSIMRAVIWCQDCAKVEDCPQHFCTSCADSEHQSKTSRHHRRIPLSEKPPRPPLCPIHHQEHLFFCCLERELVCSGCLESHVGHQVVSVEKQAESVRKLLLGLIFVVGVGGEKREVVPPLVEEVEKEMVEKEIERLEERLEEKKREKEKLEKAILKVKKQNSEFEERMGVLLGEVKGMESYEFVGKGGDLNVTRMRERIEVGVEELLGRKEEEGERRLMELKKRMEEDDMVWVVEQKEREKKKKNVLVKDKKEREKRMEEKKQFRGLLEQQRRNEKEEITQKDLDKLRSPYSIISLDVIKWELEMNDRIQKITGGDVPRARQKELLQRKDQLDQAVGRDFYLDHIYKRIQEERKWTKRLWKAGYEEEAKYSQTRIAIMLKEVETIGKPKRGTRGATKRVILPLP